MFAQDIARQVLLKLVDVLQSYSKNENGGHFILKHSILAFETQCSRFLKLHVLSFLILLWMSTICGSVADVSGGFRTSYF